MKHLIYTLLAAMILFTSCNSSNSEAKNKECQKPNVDEVTQKALEEWRSEHFGMFIHFGIYSKLAGWWNGEKIPYYGEQIMNHARIPIDEYEAVAREFNPKDFNADEIVALAKQAGMKYIVMTSKHHDGFCMFHTETTDYNIVDFTPFGRDVVKELSEACQRQGMKFGLYYSLPDWHYPLGIPRLAPDSTTKCHEYVNQVYSPLEIVTPELEDYIVAQVTELLTNYGDINTLWFDMGLVTPEQSKRFRETVKSLQPECIINGRIMNNQGDYMTLPDNGDVAGYENIFWDNPASMYGTWGYKSWINRPPVENQVAVQLGRLFSTVKHGGVFLLNIGPDGDGNVIPYEKEVLTQIGDYFRRNPDALDKIEVSYKESPVVKSENGTFELTDENGTIHAEIDGTGYMSTQVDSWRSWQLDVTEEGTYDIFIVYLPEYLDKKYSFECGEQKIVHTLPGVDQMIQTSYVGKMNLTNGNNTFQLNQAEKCYPLEPLGLELQKIIVRKR